MNDSIEQLMHFVPFILGESNIQTILKRTILPETLDLKNLYRQMEAARRQEEAGQGWDDDPQ